MRTITGIAGARCLGARTLLMLQVLCERMGEWIPVGEVHGLGLPHHRTYVRKIRLLGYGVENRKRRWRKQWISEYRLEPGRLARVRPASRPTLDSPRHRWLKCPRCGVFFAWAPGITAEGGVHGIR